jgi:hypothetical protein
MATGGMRRKRLAPMRTNNKDHSNLNDDSVPIHQRS